jgi:hypothetical protein
MMQLPLPWSGELLPGHFGRLHRWLGRRTRTDTQRMLRHRASPRRVSLLQAISFECHLPVDEYISRHSMLAYSSISVDEPFDTGRLKEFSSPSLAGYRAFATPLRGLFFCHLCARDEHAQRGYAIWHRIHQLPTATQCDVHGAPLSMAVDRENAGARDPINVYQSKEWSHKRRAEWGHNKAISKMHRMATALLASNQRWTTISDRIRLRALTTGLATRYEQSLEGCIANLAFDIFPSGFLAKLVPSLSSGVQATPIASEQSLLGPVELSANALVLVLSLLYDDPQLAFDDCMRASPRPHFLGGG